MRKKFLVLFLVAAMVATVSTASLAAQDNKIVTLKWIVVGNGMPSNYQAWQKHINAYLEKKIGVDIDVEVVPWGDWQNRRNIIVNSGEPFDILFTDSGKYLSEVNLGVFADITDLVKSAAPDLYKYIPETLWSAAKVNGKIYAVPTYKDSSMTNYIVWDKKMVDKYNVDYKNLTTLDSLSSVLKKIKDGEGTAPFVLDKNGLGAILTYYDDLGSGLPALGIKMDDQSRTVVNVFQQKDVLHDLNILHQWYQEGIINADAPTLAQAPSYRMTYIAQGWPSAAQTTWGPNMGTEAVDVQYTKPVISNTTVRGSLNAIYSGSKHPKKALEFLQLLNLDSYVRDAFYYGLEGENFKYTQDGKINKLNSDWGMAGYTQGSFFTVSQRVSDKTNQWNEVKQLNEEAMGSIMLGFNLDPANIQNELANCRAIYNKYMSELLTGARDPEKVINQMTNELNGAGFQRIMQEAQKQVDEAYQQ